MTRITLDLLRKRCEHNDGLIHTVQELALHQDNLEEIDDIGRWCKDLKILYLQGNSIQKIENLNRLKALEYLNLALNSIERIENLEGCESLQKLDLTANFIGDLTSVENLRQNACLDQLFLTGNPCAEFDGYRQYVVAALPHLKVLDGQEVSRTERIAALQEFLEIKSRVIKQQHLYKTKRDAQRADNERQLSAAEDVQRLPWSPEYRRQMTRLRAAALGQTAAARHKSRKAVLCGEEAEERTVKLVSKSGQILNVNEARLEYQLNDDEENCQFLLDVPIYRHLDTSLIDVDIQANYVRITVKGKILQLRMPEEIVASQSRAQRSSTSGHLVLTLPKAEAANRTAQRVSATMKARDARPVASSGEKCAAAIGNTAVENASRTSNTLLEVEPSAKQSCSLHICSQQRTLAEHPLHSRFSAPVRNRPDSPGFADNGDVPPLG